MKKILISLASVVALSSAVNADLVRTEMGVGIWNPTSSGGASYRDGLATGSYKSNGDDSNNMYAWLLVKHPLPILPNLRLEYTNITDTGYLKGEFKDFPGATTGSTTTIDMNQFDIVPYYNILDNTAWTTVDLGLDIKVIDAKYDVSANSTFIGYHDTVTLAIPMVYGRVRVEVPATGFGLETDVKYITYDGSSVYDVSAKVDYTFDSGTFIDPALEIGYRVQKFDIDYTDGTERTTSDLKFAGFYAGVMLRF
jgi:outer membrane protein